MGPKSEKSKKKSKSSLALVVSTPTMKVGQKRKVMDDSIKGKGKEEKG